MSVSKRVTNIILGSILFVCLLALGPGVALRTTAFDNGYVDRQLANLDVKVLIEEVALPELAQVPGLVQYGFLPGIQESLNNHQDEIKQAAAQVVAEARSYLAGESKEYDFAASVKSHLLDPELGAAVLADVDMESTVREILRSLVPTSLATYDITPYLDTSMPLLETWFKTQLIGLMPEVYDYLFANGSAPGVVNLPLDDVIEAIHLALRDEFLRAPPPEAISMSADKLGGIFDSGWSVLQKSIPASMEINLTGNLGKPMGVTLALGELNNAIHRVGPWVRLYSNIFWALVGLTALLLVIIVVINRRLLIIGIVAGTAAVLSGLLSLGGGLVGQNAARSAVAGMANVPSALKPMLNQLVHDAVNPLLIFAAVCTAAGIALLVLAAILAYRSAHAAKTPVPTLSVDL